MCALTISREIVWQMLYINLYDQYGYAGELGS